jgi:hypothetical protein
MVNAQTKMKALVVSRLLLGDIPDWPTFERERKAAGEILNRRTARSVSSQIGHNYRDLSIETRKFIDSNFVRCQYEDLARLCDGVKCGSGLSLRLEEFEKAFFALADSVKRRVPFYAHVNISTYGLKFEFPEHHFLRDIETSLPELLDTRSRLESFTTPPLNAKRDAVSVARLVARENFLSRSIVSATFSLVEAFLSGLFFTAIHTKRLGSLECDEDFLKYSATKESAALKSRLDRIVRFASKGAESGGDEPFTALIGVGKRYRDAIHHTTPFERKDVEPGGRLTALYEIQCDIAIRCVILSSAALLKISHWMYGPSDETDIASRCSDLIEKAVAGQSNSKTQSAVVAA